MRALRTIVATAVIVFTLTTVAMAGVQHFTKAGGSAQGQASAAQPVPGQGSTVTLSASQFAALLHRVDGNASGGQAKTGSRAGTQARSHRRAHARSHAADPGHAAQTVTATHHAAAHHSETHTTTTHHNGTHDGTHHSGTHHADAHGGGDGGCD